MIPAWLRLVLALPFLAAGVALFANDNPAYGACALFLAALLLAAWVRYHDIPRAAKAYGLGNRDRAWALTEKTPFGGRLLTSPCRVYYHQVRASCLIHWARWEEAALESEAALAIRATDEQKASSHASAALARMEMGDEAAAKRHYQAAKGIPHSEALARRLARLSHRLEGAAPDVTGA